MRNIGMAETVHGCPAGTPPALPFPRDTVVELAPLFRTLQSQARAVRVHTPVGDPAWLVTRYDDVKALFDDDRLVRSHPDPEKASRLSYAAILGGPEGDHTTEGADHARMRTTAASAFSGRRMAALRPRVQEIADDLLDGIAATPPPVDLHEAFSMALSVRVICELLGIPYADQGRFRGWFEVAMSPSEDGSGKAALRELLGYVGALVEEKRRAPGEDFISHVTADHDGSGALTNGHIVMMVAGLLLAGHHATVSFFDLGTVLLLTNPEKGAAVQRDPSLVDAMVEEVLRMAAPGLGVTPRYARTDIQLGDIVIPAGDAVLLSFAAANRDPGVFAGPDRLDLARRPNPHIAFGYGRYFCIGASLARIELQVGLGSLLRRFPGLRLAVPVQELGFRRDFMNSGLAALPVTW